VTVYVSVYRKSAMGKPSWFSHEGFLRPILQRLTGKFRHLQNKGTFLRNFVLNSVVKKIPPWHVDRRNVLST